MGTLVFAKLLVLFAIVAIGWAVARCGWLGGGDPARVIANAAFYIFVPALLFRTTARIDLHQLDANVLLAFFVPTLLLLAAVYGAERMSSGRRQRTSAPAEPSVRAITAVFGNSVQVGIPLATALFGETGLAIHLTIVSLHSLTLLSVLTAMVELDLARARRRAEPGGLRMARLLLGTVRNTVIHPVVLPVLAGLGWNALGLALPSAADELLGTLGQAVVPLCLVLIGVSLAQYGLHGVARGAVGSSALKLVVEPALVFVVARWGFGLAGVPLAVVVLLAALPVGSNALIFAQRYRANEAETSAAIVFSTLGFVVTAPIWLAILHAFG